MGFYYTKYWNKDENNKWNLKMKHRKKLLLMQRKCGVNMVEVKITRKQFEYLKSMRYSYSALVSLVCSITDIKKSQIDDIDYNYGLTINVYLIYEEFENKFNKKTRLYFT